MQVTQLPAEGLKRQFQIVVPASDIQTRVNSRLERLQKTVRLPGFRPGKAPLALLKKQYGTSIMGEVLEEAVDAGAKQAVGDNGLRPALRPNVEIESFDEGKDLAFKVDLEIMPEVPPVDLPAIELVRQVAPVEESRIDDALDNLARARQAFTAPAEPRPAQSGDQVVIDFKGTIDGVAFEGGSGENFPLTLGAGSMIPGFEDQLVGAAAGEARELNVTFPENYGSPDVAGKAAAFAVTVREVKEPVPVARDDDWAKGMGAEGVDDLKAKLRERFAAEYAQVGRSKLKRALLDALAERYGFAVPQSMVELEFGAIWKQLEEEMKRTGTSFADTGRTEEETRAEYRAIAERRVRLGLILSDIGTRNEVKIENEELQRAVMREAGRYPGQERQVFEFFRNNPQAMEQLRAPLFEDKVCDFIFGQARVSEQAVTPAELLRDPDDEEAPLPAATEAA